MRVGGVRMARSIEERHWAGGRRRRVGVAIFTLLNPTHGLCMKYPTLFSFVLAAAAASTPAWAQDAAAANAAKEAGAVVTPSGLVYKSLKEGSGASPKATDKVKVHYKGTFPDGKEFDSSYKTGAPAEFPLNGVIKCWTEGVQMMKVGGKARLTCPANVAYGDRGAPPTIKPGATLVFEVDLLEIVK